MHVESTSQRWAPSVETSVASPFAAIGLDQRSVRPGLGDIPAIAAGDVQNDWAPYLNPALPLTLDLSIGAGDANLAFDGITLDAPAVQSISGTAIVDLAGVAALNQAASIDVIGGDITLFLPAATSVRVDITRLPGSDLDIDPTLEKVAGDYVTPEYASAEPAMEFSSRVLAGSVTVKVASL